MNCYLKRVLIKLWQIWQNVRDDYEDTVFAGKMDAKERSMTQAPMSSRVTDCWLVNSLLRNHLFGARPCWSFTCIHTACMLASRRPLFYWKYKSLKIFLCVSLSCVSGLMKSMTVTLSLIADCLDHPVHYSYVIVRLTGCLSTWFRSTGKYLYFFIFLFSKKILKYIHTLHCNI